MPLNQKKFKTAGWGEILWDIFPDTKTLGGAPANFSLHAQQLEAESYMISCVGEDELGKEAKKLFNDFELNTNGIQVNKDLPTGSVIVSLDQMGNPSYDIKENVAWDHIVFDEAQKNIAQSLDAICFGTLAQRNPKTQKALFKTLNITPPHCLKVFDVNFRQEYYDRETVKMNLERANIVKMNQQEFNEISLMFYISRDTEKGILSLIDEFDLKLVIITLGEKGSIMATKKDYISYTPTRKIKIKSTVGAGDAYTAAVVMGWLNQKPLNQIIREASDLAANVCGYYGGSILKIKTKKNENQIN